MSLPGPHDMDALRRQARGHIESLRRAGVEWLPAASAASISLPTPAQVSEPNSPKPAPACSVRVDANATVDASVSVPTTVSVPTNVLPGPVISVTPEPTTHLTLDQRRQALQVLVTEVAACCRCGELASTRTQTVFGQGEPGVELCFIGEAPGADEDAQGLPFVGAAGQLLNRIIAACGLKREEVYICNILKCRPPGNRTPLPNEAVNCRSFLDRQLDLIRPKFICTLGGCAAQNLLGSTLTMGRLRGRFHDYKGIPVVCTYHPAYLLPHRSPEKKREVWEDMKMLLARMGRAIPQTKA
jgi:uracil-DNA glycosylase